MNSNIFVSFVVCDQMIAILIPFDPLICSLPAIRMVDENIGFQPGWLGLLPEGDFGFRK